MRDLNRRGVIGLVGGAVASPMMAWAQQPGMPPTIGFFSPNRASVQSDWTEAFVQRLRELGWIEGRTVHIEYRWAEGRTERLAEIAAELVRRRVDVIVTQGGAAVLAAKQATLLIPIVFAVAGDPVATGLVASLARPGGNVTGLSMLNTELVGKRLELLRELVPKLRQLAIIVDAGFPDGVLEMGDLRALAATVGLVVTISEVRRTEDIVPAFEKFIGRAEALYVVGAPLLTTNRARISSLAIGAR